ncbi:histidine kinase N-terminal 7TM domain-containing protein [Paenibacillus macerans]|uniref:histidine kinase N-terminal 7TM domain-containing diguanylate cyclase n=1 Tax=Paenibacillus macerans TaxID=44252 RepID=UPI003D317FAC
MGSEINVYITLVATSGVLNFFLGIYAFVNRKNIPYSRTFLVYNAALAIYIFGFAFELSSDSLEEIKRWIVVEYIGMPASAVLSLLLVFRYLGKNVSRKTTASMFVIPAITLFMVTTNDLHHLFYKAVYIRESSSMPLVDIDIGQWYIVHGAYTFGCLLGGFVLLLRRWPRTKKLYRFQHATLIISQMIPMLAAFLYLLGLTPGGMDPVPMVLCLTSAMYIWAIVSSRMLTIVPIAKESLFESMREGVIVLDGARRIVDYNRALAGLLPLIGSRVVGKPLSEAWPELTGVEFPRVENIDGMEEELRWELRGRPLTCLVRSSPVTSKGGETLGTLLLLIDVTEQKRLEDQLKQMAFQDGLTGIPNRRHFLSQGKAMLEEALAAGAPCAIILFDIDYFKRINDKYGHETGDRALVHVAEVCGRELPPGALFARYGGEEFALGLTGTAIGEAVELAERLRKALSDEPLQTGTEAISITASFGVAYSLGTGDTLEAMLQDADAALYDSKRNGRNAVSLVAAAME